MDCYFNSHWRCTVALTFYCYGLLCHNVTIMNEPPSHVLHCTTQWFTYLIRLAVVGSLNQYLPQLFKSLTHNFWLKHNHTHNTLITMCPQTPYLTNFLSIRCNAIWRSLLAILISREDLNSLLITPYYCSFLGQHKQHLNCPPLVPACHHLCNVYAWMPLHFLHLDIHTYGRAIVQYGEIFHEHW